MSRGSDDGDGGHQRSNRVAPPPFRQQRLKSHVLLIALAVVVLITVGVGMLVTVPTFASASALTIPGQEGSTSVLVLLPAAFEGRVAEGTKVRLQIAGLEAESATAVSRVEGQLDAAGAAQRFGLPGPVAGLPPGNQLAAVVDGLPAGPAPGTSGTATAEVGRRRLGAIFLGRGLKVDS